MFLAKTVNSLMAKSGMMLEQVFVAVGGPGALSFILTVGSKCFFPKRHYSNHGHMGIYISLERA